VINCEAVILMMLNCTGSVKLILSI